VQEGEELTVCTDDMEMIRHLRKTADEKVTAWTNSIFTKSKPYIEIRQGTIALRVRERVRQ